jgi:hypothetical protein
MAMQTLNEQEVACIHGGGAAWWEWFLGALCPPLLSVAIAKELTPAPKPAGGQTGAVPGALAIVFGLPSPAAPK